MSLTQQSRKYIYGHKNKSNTKVSVTVVITVIFSNYLQSKGEGYE